MTEKNFNTYASLVFVELSFTSKDFSKALIKEFPDLEDVYTKLISDTSETSQSALKSLYNHNEKNLKSFLHKFLKNNEGSFNWTTFLKKYEVTYVAGKYFKIDKNEESYAEFVRNMTNNRWSFSHMSVASEENQYVIFFA